MQVSVRLFAVAKQLAGSDCLVLELEPPATVASVRRGLLARVPALAEMGDRLLFSVDAEYAAEDQAVDDRSEIACIPPVSGG